MQEDAMEAQRRYRLEVTSVACAYADNAHLKDALPELVACIMRVLSSGSDANVTGVLMWCPVVHRMH